MSIAPLIFWNFGRGHYIKKGRSMLFLFATPENKEFFKKNRVVNLTLPLLIERKRNEKVVSKNWNISFAGDMYNRIDCGDFYCEGWNVFTWSSQS